MTDSHIVITVVPLHSSFKESCIRLGELPLHELHKFNCSEKNQIIILLEEKCCCLFGFLHLLNELIDDNSAPPHKGVTVIDESCGLARGYHSALEHRKDRLDYHEWCWVRLLVERLPHELNASEHLQERIMRSIEDTVLEGLCGHDGGNTSHNIVYFIKWALFQYLVSFVHSPFEYLHKLSFILDFPTQKKVSEERTVAGDMLGLEFKFHVVNIHLLVDSLWDQLAFVEHIELKQHIFKG